jgi:acetyltransferase-like isoleucine patch superfamily enzyme
MGRQALIEFFKQLQGRKIVVFGYGRRGRAIRRHLPVGISYFVDNDSGKWNEGTEGDVVRNPTVLAEEDRDSLFVIAVSYYYKPICWQLEDLGFTEGINFVDGLAYLGDRLNSEIAATPPPYDPRKVWLRGNPKIEGNCSFAGYNVVLDESHLIHSTLGRYSTIGRGSSLRNTRIGQFCSIGSEVLLGLERHPSRGFISTYGAFYIGKPTGIPAFSDKDLFQEGLPVAIGNDVWVGSRAVVLGGIQIGDGAIIGAGAVVTKDVKPYSVVVGVPAKVLRLRYSEEQIEKLINFAWWNKSVDWIRQHAEAFSDEKAFFDLIA